VKLSEQLRLVGCAIPPLAGQIIPTFPVVSVSFVLAYDPAGPERVDNVSVSYGYMDKSSVSLPGPVPLAPDSVPGDFSWTCGDDPHISHICKIGIGASSEVHKVPSIQGLSL